MMYEWYKRGFGTNIAIAIVGIFIAAYEFFLYSINRREYFKLNERMSELKGMKIPMNILMSRSNSKSSVYAPVPTFASDEIERVPLKVPIRNFYNRDEDEKVMGSETNFNRNRNQDGNEREKEWM